MTLIMSEILFNRGFVSEPHKNQRNVFWFKRSLVFVNYALKRVGLDNEKNISNHKTEAKINVDLTELVESPEEAIELATSCKLFSRNTNLS